MAVSTQPGRTVVPWTILTHSAQVWVSGAALIVSNVILLFLASSHVFSGPHGVWAQSAKLPYDKLQSRESEMNSTSTAMVSADLLLMLVCTMALNAFILACARVLSEAKDAVSASRRAGQDEQSDSQKQLKITIKEQKTAAQTTETPPAVQPLVAASQPPMHFDNELTDNVMMGIGGVYTIIMSVCMHALRTSELSVYTLVMGVCVIIYCTVAQRYGDGPRTLRYNCDCIHNVLMYAMGIILARSILAHRNSPISIGVHL